MARRARKVLSPEQLEAREVPAVAFALGAGANADTLFRFDTSTPATLSTGIPVTGLAAGETLVGTDFRPSNGQLYGLATGAGLLSVHLYTIDPNTGAATAVGLPAAVTGLTGATKFGVDFNPAADRLRVITDLTSDGNATGNTNNFRLNPNDGTLVAIDPDLDFTALPAGAAPEVTVAYTNNDSDPTTGTTLLGITSGSDQLVSHSVAPGFAVLTAVGALGFDTGINAGLDFFGPANTGVAILNVAGDSSLFTVNPTTGAATLVGLVGNGAFDFLDVSVAPVSAPVLASGQLNGTVTPLVPTLFSSDPAQLGQLTAGTAITVFGGSTANVRTTSGDVNGDGVADLIAVTGPGTPIRVTVISGVDNTTVLVAPFDPFGGNFTGGGYVSAGDFDPATGTGADGKAEFVVTPDLGGGPRVSVFTFAGIGAAPTVRANFFGIDDPAFRGGARSATAFLNGDAIPELVVVAGFGGGPRAAVFNGTTITATPTRLINDFFAFPGTDAVTLRNGVFVAGSDINGDGIDELVFGGGPGGAPRVFILDGALIAAGNVSGAQATPVANFFVAINSTDRGGVRVAYANLDNDARGDLVVGSGEGSAAKVRAYRGVNFTGTGEPAQFQDVTLFGGAVLPGGVFVG